MGRKRPDDSKSTDAQTKRSPHTIRFLDPEWERIEAFAEARGLAPAEFVRFATLNAIADGGRLDRRAGAAHSDDVSWHPYSGIETARRIA